MLTNITETADGLLLEFDDGLGPCGLKHDTVSAILTHELGKLGLYLAQDGRGIVAHERNAEGWHAVIWLDKESDGWDYDGVTGGNTPGGKVLAEYRATLPAEPELPKPGETWELTSPDPKVDPWRATVVVIDGLACLAWRNDAGPHICPLGAYGPRMRRKIADAPSGADQ